MTAEQIQRVYVTVPEIMAECETDRNTVYNWARYHRHFEFEYVLGRPCVLRTEFERFKREHPELVKAKSEVTL